MEEPGLDSHHRQFSQTELTSGHDVTHLLSQINQNFKQSKADQILRLLHDQDRLSDGTDECELIQEYNQIKEEKVVCDSDTLTESSSDRETIIKEDLNDMDSDFSEHKRRSRTSVGFYNGVIKENSDVNDENAGRNMDRPLNTRERSARPKSSYVRRPFRRRDEQATDVSSSNAVDDSAIQTSQRSSMSAKPRTRYGSAAARRMDKKIELFEAGEINTLSGDHLDIKIEIEDNVSTPFTNRFSMMRTAKRESKKAKKFCDDTNANHNGAESVGVNVSGVHTAEVREEVTEIQINTDPRNTMQSTHASSFVKNVPRVQYAPKTNNLHNRHQRSPNRQENSYSRPDQSSIREAYNSYSRQDGPNVPIRQHEIYNQPSKVDAVQNGYADMDTDPTPVEHVQEVVQPVVTTFRAMDHVTNSHVSVRRNDSASGYTRPKNPEPIQSRPIEGRPSTRRRLTRRYIQPTQVQKSSSIRPTSESVLLARQKTEKNLIKKQMDTRPQSEKIIVSGANKILSVAENPAQGPQTSFLTSKGGVPKPAHVQAGGFRGYDPGSRLKSSSRSRSDLPGDVTLPRPGQANVMLGGRKPLTLMKLPPLEAMAAKSKKERGLALAARETCV